MDFWDDYMHNDPQLFYISENIKTEEVENLIPGEFCGCACTDVCIPDQCSCLQRSGGFYSFTNILHLSSYVLNLVDTNKPVYECNNNCKCINKICGNKLVQYGPHKNLHIIDAEDKGAGLITKMDITKGNFICEYAGEVITQNEATQRFKTYKSIQLNHNYIFCINENFGEKNEKTFIDPTFYGNIGRYINHSCEPNSTLVPIRIHDILPKLCIFASKTISQNSEITFNYGDVGSDTSNFSKKECLCKSLKCRKFLPFDNNV